MAEEEMNPISKERTALIDKKMNMTLDDIIKASSKKKQQQPAKKIINSRQKASDMTKRKPYFVAPAADSHGSSSKLRHYTDSKPCPRQEALATFQGKQYSATSKASQKSVFHPTRLEVKKIISKTRRSIKWIVGVGFVTPSYYNKLQQNQQREREEKMIPVQRMRVQHNTARREEEVWRESRGRASFPVERNFTIH